MRGLVLVISAVAAFGLVLWTAPQVVPQPVRGALAQGVAVIAGHVAVAEPAANEPMWPDALDKSARRGPPIAWILLAGALAIAAAVGALIWRLRRQHAASGVPAWLASARTVALASSNARERRSHCDLIERKLLPDMRHRGAAALARAHQLDLYWRYVARADLAAGARVRASELERWRAVTKQTLDSIAAPVPNRLSSAFQQAKPSLWALEAGDARELRRYYDQLGTLLGEHQKAWAKARTAADTRALDQATLLDAMEELRQINRTIAKESAALVGDIEISVRAMS